MIAGTRIPTLGGHFLAPLFAAAIACLIAGEAEARKPAPVGTLKVLHLKKTGRVVLHWKGKIDRPIARSFHNAITNWQGRAHNGFIISLNSKGGRVNVAYAVVKLLRRLRRTHPVHTDVKRGNVCGSSCVPIFLQGENRTAALDSLWLFHEISSRDKAARSRIILKPGRTAKMFDDLFLPAYPRPGSTESRTASAAPTCG